VEFDESKDTSDTAHLLIVIRFLAESSEVAEELASLESLHGTTTGEDLF